MHRNKGNVFSWSLLGLLPCLASPCSGESTVVLSEIMYHPPGNEAELEWVELHNQMAVDMDISGWYLGAGIGFTFSEGTVVPGRGYLVVAAAPQALAGMGISPVYGPFTGRLDNGGERIELRNNDDRLMDWVDYNDEKSWPVAPDGSGATLAKKDRDLASSAPESWTTSAQIGGTPGASNFAEEGAPPDGLVSYWNFDQQSGQLLDLADGNNGSLGTGAKRTAGIVGTGAVSFDNTTGAYVSVGIGTDNNFSVSAGITVEAIIVPTWSSASSDEDTIFRKEDGPLRITFSFQNDASASNRDVSIDPPEQPVLSWGLNVGGTYTELDMPFDGLSGRPSLAEVKDGEPHHVAATYDVQQGLKAIYFDGQRVFEFSFAPGTAVASGGTTTAYIGNMSGRTRPFTGLIDEVAFWRRALSAAEVGQHFERFRAGRNYFDEASAVTGGPRLAFNEYFTSTVEPSWLEIVNCGDAPAPLAGHILSVFDAPEREYVFPAEELPPGGFVIVTGAELQVSFDDKLFLYAPGRAAALDGLRIEENHRARHPEGTGRWLYAPRPTPGEANRFELHDDIVINEILYHPRVIVEGTTVTESPEAWLELYNRGPVTVDLTGWRLDDGVEYDFEEGTTLGPREYLVVAADREYVAALHPGIRILGNFQGRLSRKDDRIALEDPRGNVADEVHYYDGGRWPSHADGGGSSLELRDPRADNSAAEAWAASDESSKSQWKDYSYRGVASQNVGPTRWNELVMGLLDEGEVLIDDLSVLESPSSTRRELLQNGGFEPDAGSWRFLGTHRHSEAVPDPDSPGGHVLHLAATDATEHMHNHIETTYKSGLSVVNGREYEISFRARWLAGSNQLNTRLYFNRLPKTTLLDVPRAAGTPGARNSVFAANIGPTFGGLSHSPVAPQAGEDVAVRVDVNDPDGVAEVILWWNVSGTGWNSSPMAAGEDGAWAGTIPGQTATALVQFYVEAEDLAGASSTFPAAGRDSRALLRANDGQAKRGQVHTLRILMLPEDATFMHLETNVMSNEWLPCTVVYDERTAFHDCGVRLKGSERGRPVSGRVGFHLKFPPDRLFRGVHPTVHIDRSGGWVFGGPSGQDEILVKHAVNHAGGIPGMYDDIVRIIAPRSEQNGPALLLMGAFNDVYLDSQWENGSEGTAYKLELIYYPTTTVDGDPESLKRPQPDDVLGNDLQDLGNDKEAYRWTFLIENNRDRDDYGRLIALCKAMGRPTAELDAATRAVMDVDQWMRTFTIISLFGVTDTYTQGNNHNNIFYVRPSDGKMLAFPWDMDFAWVRSTNAPLWGDQNLARVIQLPGNQRRFYGHLLDIISTTFNSTYMSPWASHYAELAEEDYTTLVTYISQRRSFVLSTIPARIPFAITTNGGADFSTAQLSTYLEGNAWYDVSYIVASNHLVPMELNWSTTTRWRGSVDLDFGPNPLELLAFDRYGNLIDSDTITVTSTGGGPAPGITKIAPERALAGETVRLEGSGFQSGADVFFGETKSGNVVVGGPALIQAVVPAAPPGSCDLTVRNPDGRASPPVNFTVREIPRFIRGDANSDGRVDLSDALRVLVHLFSGQPSSCPDALDADDTESLDLTDALRILNHLFRAGAAPPAPYPEPGVDPGGTALGCEGP